MAKQAIKLHPIELRIVNIDATDFKLSVLEDAEKDKIKTEDITFEFNLHYSLNEEAKTMTIESLTKIFSDKSKSLNLGEMKSVAIFEIPNIEKVLNDEKKLPMDLIATLMGVLLSTTRGFLILKSKGTILQGSIIPVINPSEFFNQQS